MSVAFKELQKRSKELQKITVEYLRMIPVEFLLFLLMVDVKIDADKEALATVKKYLQELDAEVAAENLEQDTPGKKRTVIISVAPHTGHPDSLYVIKFLKELFPEIFSETQLVSAADTWSNSFKRALATFFVGELILFNREAVLRTELKKLAKELENISLVIYAQGTREPGAPVQEGPVALSGMSKKLLLVVNIYGAEEVFPKKGSKAQIAIQVFTIAAKRLTRRKRIHHVTVRLEKALFPPSGSKKERKAKEEEFLKAHGRELQKEES